MSNQKKKALVMDLPVRLTQEQCRQRGQELAAAHAKARVLEEEQKSIKGAWKKRSEQIDADMRRLSRIVEKGEEIRPVECDELPNYSERTVEIIRTDTGEHVSYRAMSEHELQTQLPL